MSATEVGITNQDASQQMLDRADRLHPESRDDQQQIAGRQVLERCANLAESM